MKQCSTSGSRDESCETTRHRSRTCVLGAVACIVLGAISLLAPPQPALADSSPSTPYVMTIMPDNALDFCLLYNGKGFATTHVTGWGPNWAWAPPSRQGYAYGGALDVTAPFLSTAANSGIALREQVRQSSATSITLKYSLSAQQNVALTELIYGFTFPSGATGTIDMIHSDGKTDTLPLPTAFRGGSVDDVVKFVLRPAGDGEITFTLDAPVSFYVENNDLRLALAYGTYAAGEKSVTATITFPAPVTFAGSQADVEAMTKTMADGPSWFIWSPADDNGPSEIGMQDWLDAPAGKHGGVRIDGDHFAFADGTPVKFWGTNLAYTQNTPEKADAVFTAQRLAKYGINAVRMHKFTNPGEGIGTDAGSLDFDPVALDKLDYFTFQLKQNGIYYGWSHSFHYRVRGDDALSLLDYQEIVANNSNGDTYDVINGAPDVQNRMIAMVVKLLQHVNPYTGLRYADDPALSFLEVQNEDDIFFWNFSNFDKYPHYKDAMRQRFGDWLKARYATQAALAQAWGTALNGAEVGEKVDFQTNPWQFTDDGLAKLGTTPGARRRILDTAQFYYAEQVDFYNRFASAVRAAGYKGPINGSPWWAPTTLPQYLDLRADAQTGYVDRHNYFGGDSIFGTMLSDPGSGYLNTGLLHVAGHPFTLSEWCHVYPDALSAEGPAIMAVYGLGLQGWDGSYEFQSYSGHSSFVADAGHLPWNIWNTDLPNQIGQFPALARMIYRGDVREGAPVAVKRVSDEQLDNGTFDFNDSANPGAVPQEALALGRTLVQFTSTTTPSTFLSTSFLADKVIASNTRQLVWDYSGKGYFRVATPGTVGVVGFAQNIPVVGSGVQIRLASAYASVFVTALEKNATLANCRRALITAVAKECNSGFTYYQPTGSIMDNGKGPIMVEGVSATFTFDRPIAQVNVLDQDGRLQPGRTMPVSADGDFSVDGGADRTIYYEVVFK